MAVYTNLTPMEIELILLEYGLELVDCSRIKIGILNTNYYVESSNEKFVMRIFEGNRSIEEENQELNLLFDLKNIIPCCIPVKILNGENYTLFKDKMIALFKFIEGKAIKKIDEKILKEIGKYLGKFHSFSKGRQLHRKSRVDMEAYYKKIDFNSIPISTSEKMKLHLLYEMAITFIFLRLNKFILENLNGVYIEDKNYSQLLPLLNSI